jgi:hypothetical protein
MTAGGFMDVIFPNIAVNRSFNFPDSGSSTIL